MRNDISAVMKQTLERQMDLLDPMMLLKHIREAQGMLMALSENRFPETVAPDVSTFVRSLARLWRTGEVRPTNARKRSPGIGGGRGLIRLPQYGRSCLDGWRKSPTSKQSHCYSDCNPAAMENFLTGSYVLCNAAFGCGGNEWYSNWSVGLSSRKQTL
jgi:hypothetical protein